MYSTFPDSPPNQTRLVVVERFHRIQEVQVTTPESLRHAAARQPMRRDPKRPDRSTLNGSRSGSPTGQGCRSEPDHSLSDRLQTPHDSTSRSACRRYD